MNPAATTTPTRLADAGPKKRQRAGVVDAVRGLAVISMITWHTADAWLDAAQRQTAAFEGVIILGGLAAPLFLLLAGVSAALAEPETHTRATSGRAVRRALQIIVAGYALKLFAFGIDRTGLFGTHAPAVILGALGLAAAHASLGELTWLPPSHRRSQSRWLLGALGAAAISAELVLLRDDARAFELVVRLDVLQGIGAALLVLTPILAATRATASGRRSAEALSLLGLGLLVAFATPPLGALDLHPTSFARLLDYVARLTPYPAPTGARFPLFPWLSYTLVGAAMGRAMRGRSHRGEFGLPVPFAGGPTLVIALVMTYLSFEAGDAAQFFITRSEIFRNVVRLAFNTGAAVTGAGLVAVIAAGGNHVPRFLALLGRNSLIIYAVHLEIAYGLVSIPIFHILPWAVWAALGTLLTMLMGVLAWAIEQRASARASARALQA